MNLDTGVLEVPVSTVGNLGTGHQNAPASVFKSNTDF